MQVLSIEGRKNQTISNPCKLKFHSIFNPNVCEEGIWNLKREIENHHKEIDVPSKMVLDMSQHVL